MAASAFFAASPVGFFPSIALIRAAAALLVVWDHLFNVWPNRAGISFAPAAVVERWVMTPLSLMQHGGAFAVALFFMVSGFIIVHVGLSETGRTFAIRRALRIYPPLWASIALLIIVYPFAVAIGMEGYAINKVLQSEHVWERTLLAMTLLNYLVGTPPINGVAWTLIVEVLFYVTVWALLPLLRRRPRLAVIVAFVALLALQTWARVHSVVFLIAVNMVYVTYLFLGVLIYLRFSGKVGSGFFLAATALYWGLFIVGVDRFIAQPPWTLSGYGVSYGFAWLVFVVLLLADRHIRLDPVTRFFSRISYSLYLNHGGLGTVALLALVPVLGYPVSVFLTFFAVVAVSAASYRWVELPSQRCARALAPSVPTPKAAPAM